MYIYIYIHIHIYTHTHTPTHVLSACVFVCLPKHATSQTERQRARNQPRFASQHKFQAETT